MARKSKTITTNTKLAMTLLLAGSFLLGPGAQAATQAATNLTQNRLHAEIAKQNL